MNTVAALNPTLSAALVSLRVGIEFETYHPDGLGTVFPKIQDRLYCSRNYTPRPNDGGFWGIGYDSSVGSPGNTQTQIEKECGIEFRSPVFAVNGDAVCDNGSIARALRVARLVGCTTNHRCGIHVHVSNAVMPFNALRIALKLEALPYRHANKYRAFRYCGLPGQSRNDNLVHHSAVARVNDKHVEVRVFNGSLNVRHVYRSITCAIRLAQEDLQVQASFKESA